MLLRQNERFKMIIRIGDLDKLTILINVNFRQIVHNVKSKPDSLIHHRPIFANP